MNNAKDFSRVSPNPCGMRDGLERDEVSLVDNTEDPLVALDRLPVDKEEW